MNFSEKLSIKKVYANAAKYIVAHPKGFLFLIFFYYLVSLLPIANAYLHLLSLYLLLYFAAGLYYKQQIILNTSIFLQAALRFITAIMLFIISMLLSSFILNIVLNMLPEADTYINQIMESTPWLTAKYAVLFFLLIIFFLIPSFAFISEISGKSRSIINAYAKTGGNIHKISLVVLVAVTLTWLALAFFAFVTPYIAQLAYTMALVFNTILYFKMYDFFYNIPQTKRPAKSKAKDEKPLKPAKPEENKANAD